LRVSRGELKLFIKKVASPNNFSYI